MNIKSVFAVALFCLLGCIENPVIEKANADPIAHAGPNQEFNGSGPVMVTLDGSESMDADGMITEYRWLSATTPPAGGRGRYVPPGESQEWPADVEKPTVQLPMGLWVFSLQVRDNSHAWSTQATVTIGVGVPVPARAGSGGAGGAAGGSGGAGTSGGRGGA